MRALLADDIPETLIDQWSQSCQSNYSNMADVLSSNSSEEDDAVTNPIQLAINKGANITEPDRAAISRKRKIVKNSGKYKASRVKNHSKNDTCVWDRLKDFPGQHFVNENGQLRCNACSEIISIKKSSIEKARPIEKTCKRNCKHRQKQKGEPDYFGVFKKARYTRSCERLNFT